MRTKHLFLVLILWAIFFYSCAVPKQLAQTRKEISDKEEVRAEKTTGEVLQLIDTTKREGLEVTYTKIEFYPPEAKKPAGPEEAEPIKEPEGLDNNKKEPTPKEKQPPNKQGSIKSIEQYTVKHNKEEAGVSIEKENIDIEKQEAINTEIQTDETVTEQPGRDPYRWRYILAIIVIILGVCIVGYFCLRKTKIFISIASFFKNLFF